MALGQYAAEVRQLSTAVTTYRLTTSSTRVDRYGIPELTKSSARAVLVVLNQTVSPAPRNRTRPRPSANARGG